MLPELDHWTVFPKSLEIKHKMKIQNTFKKILIKNTYITSYHFNMAMILSTLTFTISLFCMTFTGQSVGESMSQVCFAIRRLEKLLQLYFFGCLHDKTDAFLLYPILLLSCCELVAKHLPCHKNSHNMYKEHFTDSWVALRHL